MEDLKIVVPMGYEIDKENSTFELIKFKKLDEIKTMEDLHDSEIRFTGYYIDTSALVERGSYINHSIENDNVFLTEKEANSSLAMSKISQLMPYYGGAITQEEWNNIDIPKFSIIRDRDGIDFYLNHNFYMFLSFHTSEQRDRFLENNEQLIKDYLMLD